MRSAVAAPLTKCIMLSSWEDVEAPQAKWCSSEDAKQWKSWFEDYVMWKLNAT